MSSAVKKPIKEGAPQTPAAETPAQVKQPAKQQDTALATTEEKGMATLDYQFHQEQQPIRGYYLVEARRHSPQTLHVRLPFRYPNSPQNILRIADFPSYNNRTLNHETTTTLHLCRLLFWMIL